MSARMSVVWSIVALAAAAALPAACAGEPLPAESRVAAVTVFPDRAVVTRRFEVELPAGRSIILLDGLLPGLDERTLKCLPAADVKGVAVADLASEVYRRVAPQRADLAALEAERGQLDAQIRALEDEIVALHERVRVLAEYRTLAIQAMKWGLPAKEPKVEDWRKALEFVSAEALAASVKVREIEKRKFGLNESLKELDARINLIKNPAGSLVRRARVAVDCREAGRRAFELSYLVQGGVRWGPQYELRLDRKAGKVELTSLGAVSQETGEDWAGALLAFSTRNPARGLRPPEPETLFIGAVERPSRASTLASVEVKEDVRLEPPEPRFAARSGAASPANEATEQPVAGKPAPPPVGAAPRLSPQESRGVPELRAGGETVEFAARDRVAVRSDGQPVLVPLGRWTAKCPWHLESVPKLLGAVYIRGAFANPTEAVMLPGPGECYVDGEYIGKVEVPLSPAGSAVELSFGAVEGLSVTRTAEPLESKRRGLRGAGRVYQYAYVIELANATAGPVEVAVLEAIPVSTVKAVVVELGAETTPGEKLDGGRLRWRVELAPGARKQVKLAYTVDIAKDYRY